MTLLRALTRLLGFLLLAALALAGLAIAVFCIEGGSSGLSLPALAKHLHLADVRDSVGSTLTTLEKPGPLAVLGLLCGLGAIVLGLALLAGAFATRRERLAVASTSEEGTLAARRRALRSTAAWLVESARGVTQTQVKLRTGRRGRGGKLHVIAYRPRTAEDAQVRDSSHEALHDLASAFSLKEQIDVRAGGKGARVQ